MNKIEVKTEFNKNLITQEVIDAVGDIRNAMLRQVIRLQDQGVRDALIELGWMPPDAQAEKEPVAKPYAYEYGRENGDGTYSVVIEKGDLVQIKPAVYEYVRPRNAHKDWPIKELFDLPPPQPKEPEQEPTKLWCETCEGTGEVHQEHQAGCHVGGNFKCPDCDGEGYIFSRLYSTTPQQRKPLDFGYFFEWANDNGYDTAHTYDGSKWICLNPMTNDLWKVWQAAHGIKE